MALELPQNGWQASLRKKGMQGIKLNHWAGKSRTKAALAHPPLVPSTRATLSACGKKRPSGLLAATLHPLAAPLPNSAPKRYTIQPPLPLDTYTPLALYVPKRPLYQSNSAQATNLFLCSAWLSLQGSSALDLQMGCPWLCSKLLLQSWSLPVTLSLPCLWTLGWLLTPLPKFPARLPSFISSLPAPCYSLPSLQHLDYI